MKISEQVRTSMGLEMIEDIATCAQSTDPKRDWKKSHDAVCKIYEIVHSIRSVACRKNHPQWCQQIDDAIVGEINGLRAGIKKD